MTPREKIEWANTLTSLMIKTLVGTSKPEDEPDILVVLEGVISGVLLYTSHMDDRRAATMLNEGLVPGVERRLAQAAQKGRTKK